MQSKITKYINQQRTTTKPCPEARCCESTHRQAFSRFKFQAQLCSAWLCDQFLLPFLDLLPHPWNGGSELCHWDSWDKLRRPPESSTSFLSTREQHRGTEWPGVVPSSAPPRPPQHRPGMQANSAAENNWKSRLRVKNTLLKVSERKEVGKELKS